MQEKEVGLGNRGDALALCLAYLCVSGQKQMKRRTQHTFTLALRQSEQPFRDLVWNFLVPPIEWPNGAS